MKKKFILKKMNPIDIKCDYYEETENKIDEKNLEKSNKRVKQNKNLSHKLKCNIGDKVHHKKLGYGFISKIKPCYIVIKFDSGKESEFNIKIFLSNDYFTLV